MIIIRLFMNKKCTNVIIYDLNDTCKRTLEFPLSFLCWWWLDLEKIYAQWSPWSSPAWRNSQNWITHQIQHMLGFYSLVLDLSTGAGSHLWLLKLLLLGLKMERFRFQLIHCCVGHRFFLQRIPLIDDSLTEEIFSTVSSNSMFT